MWNLKERWARRGYYICVLLCAWLVVVGCSDPEPDVCDPCATSAIVYGTVTKSGQPMAGATVGVSVLTSDCSTDIGQGAGVATSTDGKYRTSILVASAPFTACINVRVIDSNPGGPDVTVQGATVRFLPDFGDNVERDSVRVDVVVP